MNFLELTDIQLDALKEISNVGAGNGATALSQLLGRKIDMEVPSVKILDIEDIYQKVHVEEAVAGVLVEVHGDAPGNILFVFREGIAFDIINMLTGSNENNLDEMGRSVLCEIGNIISGAYMNAISVFTGLTLVPSVPAIAHDFAGAILSSTFIASIDKVDKILEIKTILKGDENNKLAGDFYYLPKQDSLEKIFSSIGLI